MKYLQLKREGLLLEYFFNKYNSGIITKEQYNRIYDRLSDEHRTCYLRTDFKFKTPYKIIKVRGMKCTIKSEFGVEIEKMYNELYFKS